MLEFALALELSVHHTHPLFFSVIVIVIAFVTVVAVVAVAVVAVVVAVAVAVVVVAVVVDVAVVVVVVVAVVDVLLLSLLLLLLLLLLMLLLLLLLLQICLVLCSTSIAATIVRRRIVGLISRLLLHRHRHLSKIEPNITKRLLLRLLLLLLTLALALELLPKGVVHLGLTLVFVVKKVTSGFTQVDPNRSRSHKRTKIVTSARKSRGTKAQYSADDKEKRGNPLCAFLLSIFRASY